MAGHARGHTPGNRGAKWAAEPHLSSWDLGVLAVEWLLVVVIAERPGQGKMGAEQEGGKAGGFLKQSWFPGEGGGALAGVLWWQLGDMALPHCELQWPCHSLPQDVGADGQEQGLTAQPGVRVAPSQLHPKTLGFLATFKSRHQDRETGCLPVLPDSPFSTSPSTPCLTSQISGFSPKPGSCLPLTSGVISSR